MEAPRRYHLGGAEGDRSSGAQQGAVMASVDVYRKKLEMPALVH